YPDVNPPSPEISNEESFQAKGDLLKSIQTFLESFNCIPFEEKPQILFLTWETFFAIQCSQPKDSNELFQKLLKDLKELAEYDQSISTDRPIFLNDNKDHPVQNRESPKNSSEENVVSKTIQEPPQDSDIHQLIEECSIEVPEEQKHNMEKTMLDLVKIYHHKQFLCIHDDVGDLIESALDSKLLLINSINFQRLDKKEQEVKIVEEQPAERRNRPMLIKLFDVVWLAKKLLTSSMLVIVDPPGDTMKPTTQRRKFLTQVEAKALPTNDARVVVKFLKSLFSRFGTPKAIISDRGTHFCNDQFSRVMAKYRVTHRLSTTYHPQTSGLKIFSGKLKSRWSGPFTISEIYPYGTAKLIHPDGCNFKVKCHQLKHYHGGDPPPLEIPDVTTFPKDN
nr:reverse transcriptase domain-containing protein [Tanacetum cinerariifolium]